MWVFVEPFDVWLFRDGKPFTAGDQVRATGMFPPLPSTFQGVLRSAALARALDARGSSFDKFRDPADMATRDLRDRWGDAGDSYGAFRMRGPFVARTTTHGVEALLAAPADLLIGAEQFRLAREQQPLAAGEAVRGGLDQPSSASRDGADGLWSKGWPGALSLHGAPEYEGLTPAGRLTPVQLAQYLLGTIDGPPEPEGDVIRSDLRIGIEQDREHGTAAHGRFYQAHFLRPLDGAGLLADVTFDGAARDLRADLGSAGEMAIGGEARAGRYRILADNPLEAVEGQGFRDELVAQLHDSRFRLVLLTPGLFERGWCPDFVDPGNGFKGTLAGLVVRLDGAAVPKPVPVSGWDLASNAPKPLRWAVAAGVTYTFQVIGAERDWAARLVGDVHGHSIAKGQRGSRWEIGMAVAHVGVA